MQNLSSSFRNSLRMNQHGKERLTVDQSDAVTVKVEGKEFVVKRSLLLDNSSYFKEKLPLIETTGSVSKKKKVANASLELNGLSKTSFKWLIKFMLDDRLDVSKCLEDEEIRDAAEIVDAARLIRYEDLLRACTGFAENWYANGNLDASYSMAKKLGMEETVEDMRLLVFRLLLPDNGQEITRSADVKLEDVPFNLLIDSLTSYDQDEDKKRLVVSLKDERSTPYLLSRLKKILRWLVARRDVPANGPQRLLSRLLLEELPLPKIEEAVREILIHKNKYPSLVRAVEGELIQIKRDIASKVSELVIIESKGLGENESKISKYVCGEGQERWKEIFFKVDFELVDASIVSDVLYLFGIRSLATYRVITSDKVGFQRYSLETFACKSVYVDQHAIYLIGDDSKNGCLTLGTYDFMALSWTWKPLQPVLANRPALTVHEGVAYFLNGNRCYRSHLNGTQACSTCILTDLRILPHDRQAKPFLVYLRGFLYVFSGSTFFKVSLEREQYMENLGWTLSNVLDLKQRAVCAGEEGIFVSATTEKNDEDLRIVQYDFKTDKYPTIGYLPSHSLILNANRFYILRNKHQ